ncbi:MAG: vanadium-dependent haloperoxidase [Bacillota bacterium]
MDSDVILKTTGDSEKPETKKLLVEIKSSLKKRVNLPRKWSQLSYAGEARVPQGLDPSAGSWPLYFMKRDQAGDFTTLDGKKITFEIQNPDNFNFDEELVIVQETLDNLTYKQKQIACYWGDGPATKQWTPIIDRLIDTYNLSPVRAARVLAAVQAGINDAFIIAWYYKYLWDVPRPNQLDQKLLTYICTPRFPTYPAGHSVISGTAEVILSYFFSPEAERLKALAEEDSISRLYGGVHFPADLSEGLRLGRQIGEIVVDVLKNQRDNHQSMIDAPIIINKHAKLMPPPYKQVIPYPPRARACDLPLLPE